MVVMYTCNVHGHYLKRLVDLLLFLCNNNFITVVSSLLLCFILAYLFALKAFDFFSICQRAHFTILQDNTASIVYAMANDCPSGCK